MSGITRTVTFKCGLISCRTLTRLSYIHNIGKEPLQFLTIGNLVQKSASKYGDKTAVISVQDNKKMTFQEILLESDKLAAGFLRLGLQSGDRVGLWAPNIIEWIVTFFAAARADLTMVALNPVYQKQDLEYSINKVGIKALVCPDTYKRIKFYDTLCNVVPEIQESDPGKISSVKVPSLKSVIAISDNALRGAYNYKEVLEMADNIGVKKILKMQNYIQPDGMANIQYSSGTTGKPKAACLSHFQLVNNAYETGKRIELDKANHKICVQVPFFHVFGIVAAILPSYHFGSTLVLPSPMYNSSANIHAIDDQKCSVVYGTPTMFVDLVNQQRKEKRNISPSIALSGGAPCSPQLFRDMKEVLNLTRVKSIYGLTETTCVSFHSLPIEEDEHKTINTVGHLGDHLEAKIINENNEIVPIGSPGELCIRGYSVMIGYWGDEEKTKEILGADRWLKTGDQFILQEDGYGKIIGRLKDMIIRGGENIFPKEIEDFLNTHPDILENYVVGIFHQRLGEEVCACIRVKSGSEFNYNSLLEFCTGKLTSYKIPTKLKIVDAFPKTLSGKVQKFILKQQIEDGKL